MKKFKKKIALCLFGTFFNYKKVNDKKKGSNNYFEPKVLYNELNKNLLSEYDIDIFFHTWKNRYKKQILKLYKPKKFIIEKFKKGKFDLFDYNLNYINFYDDVSKLKSENKNPVEVYKNSVYRANSRWYSQCKSLELMKNYKDNFNENYELVIQSRFDLKFNIKINLNKLNKKILHLVKSNKENKLMLNDIFFISNYQNALKFLNIYKNLNKYPIDPPMLMRVFVDENDIKYKFSFSFNQIMIYRFHEIFFNISIIRKLKLKFLAFLLFVFDKTQKINNKIINRINQKLQI